MLLLLLSLLSSASAEPEDPTTDEQTPAPVDGEPAADTPASDAPQADEPPASEPSSQPWALPPEPTPAERPPPAGFDEQLEEAKRLHFQGEHQAALDLLNHLKVQMDLSVNEVSWTLRAETLVYLGELQYVTGNTVQALSAWRSVLEQDLAYPRLSPFSHPPEVVGEFEQLRARIHQEVAARPVPRPPPTPAWTVLPLGIPQFIDGHPVRGTVFGVSQLALGTVSLAMIAHLNARNVPSEDHPQGWTSKQVTARVNTQRFAIQWPATLGFYGVWFGSWNDARQTWRKEHTVSAQVGWAPTREAPGSFGVSGRF